MSHLCYYLCYLELACHRTTLALRVTSFTMDHFTNETSPTSLTIQTVFKSFVAHVFCFRTGSIVHDYNKAGKDEAKNTVSRT